jgi:hypothetical protein
LTKGAAVHGISLKSFDETAAGNSAVDPSVGERLMKKKDDPDRPYDIGYGKPPIQHRFQPGQSGKS